MRFTKQKLQSLGRVAKAALTAAAPSNAVSTGGPILVEEGVNLVSVPTFHFNYRKESYLFDRDRFEEQLMNIRTDLIEVARRSELQDPPLIQKVVAIIPPIAENDAATLTSELVLCAFKSRYTDEGEDYPPLITDAEVEPRLTCNFRIRLTGLTALKQHMNLISDVVYRGLGITAWVACNATFGFLNDEGVLKFGMLAYVGNEYILTNAVICDEFEDLGDYACEVIVSMVFDYDEVDEQFKASSIAVHQPSVAHGDPLSETSFDAAHVLLETMNDTPIYVSQCLWYSDDGVTSPAIGATTYGVETEYLPGYDGLGVPDIWRPIRTIDTALIPDECAGKIIKVESVDPGTRVLSAYSVDLQDSTLVEVGDHLFLDSQKNILQVQKVGRLP